MGKILTLSEEAESAGAYGNLDLAGTVSDADHSGHKKAVLSGKRFTKHRLDLDNLLQRLRETVTLLAHDRVVNLSGDLDGFALKVSLIGQVKAGKTALTNALIGKPDMLPSDVNPWTSVVTSVHINTLKPTGKTAVFNFFTTQEWLDMVEAGGTLGALANRANFADEADAMRAQIRDMQRRTEQRLGRNFKLLMGSKHSFLGFSSGMLRKYVCLGDESDVSASEGRYADVTKSAELYIDSDAYRVPTVIQDTPGVNDPFLMREAVTLDSLSDTDICILVLGAQQSFSTVDVGLLRILRSLKQEQIILFVNRIDELPDPETQIPEIDSYIRGVLRDEQLSADVPIIFGSAAWAEMASFGMAGNIGQASLERLADLAAKRSEKNGDTQAIHHPVGSLAYTTAKTNDLSGFFDLRSLIAQKSVVDIALPHLARISSSALDVARSSQLLLEQAQNSDWALSEAFDIKTAVSAVENIQETTRTVCAEQIKTASAAMFDDISAAYAAFLERERDTLSDVARAGKPLDEWEPDVEALRRALITIYKQFGDQITSEIDHILVEAAQKLQTIYNDALNNPAQFFQVEQLHSNHPPKPICLMKTMPLDISSNWLSRWMSRKTQLASFQEKLKRLVEAEEMLVVDEIQQSCVDDFAAENLMIVDGFFDDHIQGLRNLVRLNDKDTREQALQALGMKDQIQQRLEALAGIIADLNRVSQRIQQDIKSVKEFL